MQIFEMMWSEGRDAWWRSRGPDVIEEMGERRRGARRMLLTRANVPTGDNGDWKLPFLVQR